MEKQDSIFLSIFICITIFLVITMSCYHICFAQGGWPPYTQNVLLNPLLEYINAATLPGSIMVSGCWGYPWFAVPGGDLPPSNGWSYKKYYMYFPSIGWFDQSIYPFWHVYNVAAPYQDFPNFLTLVDNPSTWVDLPLEVMLNCQDPICYYLAGGIHFFSGALLSPFSALMNNNPSIDPMLLRYLGLMGLFEYDIPSRLVTLPSPVL